MQKTNVMLGVKAKTGLLDERGASLMIALMAFLVAAMVSVVVVTAANTSIKRVYDNRQQEQAHLTASSATQLVSAEMQKTKVAGTVVKTTDTKTQKTTTSYTFDSYSGAFGTEMKTALDYVCTYDKNYDSTSTPATTTTISVSGLDMSDATADFVMWSDADSVTGNYGKYWVVFSVYDATKGKTLYLIMVCNISEQSSSESTSGSTTKTTKSVTYTWSQSEIKSFV